MKKIIFSLAIGFLILSGMEQVFAAERAYEKALKQANQLYSQSKYDKALAKYQKLSLIEARPEAYYNLGNAYYKTKKLGLAIASYEKAQLLAPRDSDIRKNLRFASGLIQSKISDQRDWLIQELEALFSYATLTELEIAGLAILAVILVWMILLLTFGRNPFRGWVLRIFMTLLVFSVLASGLKYYFLFGETSGVVIRQDAEVRYGPARDEKIVFRLPEGIKVRLLEDREGWERVQLPNKDTGWISKDDIEIIKIV